MSNNECSLCMIGSCNIITCLYENNYNAENGRVIIVSHVIVYYNNVVIRFVVATRS